MQFDHLRQKNQNKHQKVSIIKNIGITSVLIIINQSTLAKLTMNISFPIKIITTSLI